MDISQTIGNLITLTIFILLPIKIIWSGIESEETFVHRNKAILLSNEVLKWRNRILSGSAYLSIISLLGIGGCPDGIVHPRWLLAMATLAVTTYVFSKIFMEKNNFIIRKIRFIDENHASCRVNILFERLDTQSEAGTVLNISFFHPGTNTQVYLYKKEFFELLKLEELLSDCPVNTTIEFDEAAELTYSNPSSNLFYIRLYEPVGAYTIIPEINLPHISF